MLVGRDLIERFYATFAVKADSCAPDVRFWDLVPRGCRQALLVTAGPQPPCRIRRLIITISMIYPGLCFRMVGRSASAGWA